MNLPNDFHFTASNVQDYVTCERRFVLKYIEQLLWPALPSQPVQEHERQIQNGSLFHQYVQQCFLGIPLDRIETLIQEPDLIQWWQNFQKYFPEEERRNFIAYEISLSGRIAAFPVLAKLDAVHFQDEIWTIYDWKTGFRLPKAQTMQAKIQSRLYPLMLAKCGTRLNHGNPILPEAIRMVYWFPEFPDEPIIIQYDEPQYAADEAFITNLLQEITDKPKDGFSLTSDERNCKYCIYRSLCDRGTIPGQFSALQDDELPSEPLDSSFDMLDFDQLTEIAF